MSRSRSKSTDGNELVWLTRIELLQIVRHEFSGVIHGLAHTLALILASRSNSEKIVALVKDAENNLRSLSRLEETMRMSLNTRTKPSEMTTRENLTDIAKTAISILDHAARGVGEIRLKGDQGIVCLCDRRMTEFMFTSILLFLLRALRREQSREGIWISMEEEQKVAHVNIRFDLGGKWEEDSNDDDLSWRVATTLIKNMGGSIEPSDFSRLSQHLRITLPKGTPR